MPLKNDSDTVARTPADTTRRRSRFTVRRSPVHGRGVFATHALAAGEHVCEYRGERISWDEALLRHPRNPAHPDHTFYFDVGDGTVIDGAVGGNSARWINHACSPNCEAEDRNGRIFTKTVRPIRSGEELSIDYALFVEGRYTRQLRQRYACHCGSPDCRGTMLAERRWQLKVTPQSTPAPDRLADVANLSAAPQTAASIVERQSQDPLVVA
ncbi:SET domain-containing protein [Paraburkholderia caledonica]|uniref:SET domain-containing protein n=1 Tax=Paraburkholderia caledonica TaxID=134536 RepID=UPI003709C1CB